MSVWILLLLVDQRLSAQSVAASFTVQNLAFYSLSVYYDFDNVTDGQEKTCVHFRSFLLSEHLLVRHPMVQIGTAPGVGEHMFTRLSIWKLYPNELEQFHRGH